METLGIIHNLSLLTTVVLFFILISDRWHSDSRFRAVFFGFIFGCITIIVMMDPFYISEGLFFDGRSILLGLSGLFGGPIAATISAAIAAFYRLEIDGVGTGVGIASIIASSAVGVLFHYLFILKNRTEGRYLLFTGFVVHVTVLAIMLFLPEPARREVFRHMALPYLVLFPVVFFILAKLFLAIESTIRNRQRLAESEKRYRALFKGNRAVELIIDPKSGQIVDCNESALRYYGYSYAEMTAMQVSGINILSSEAIAREMSLAEEQQRDMFYFKHRLSDGEIRDVEVYSGPVELDDRVLLYSIVFDVTERLRLEQYKREVEERYRFAAEAAYDGIWDWDLVTNKLYLSPSWKAILGYRDDEMRSAYEEWESRIHPLDREQILLDVQASHRGETKLYKNVHRLKHRDGRWVWIEARGQTLFDETHRPVRMVGTHTDITQAKEREQTILYLKELYDNIIDSVNILIFVKDTDFTYITCNKAFEKFIGRSKEEIIGKNDYDFFTKEVADIFRDYDKQMIIENQRKSNFEWVTYPDGTKVYLLTVKSPLLDSHGSLLGLVGTSTDFTKQQKLNDRLNEAQALAKLGSWEYDIAEDRLTCTDEIYRIYGFRDLNMRLSRKTFFDQYHPDEVEMAERDFRHSLGMTGTTLTHNRIIRQDTGEIRYVEHRWNTEHEGGTAVKTVGTTQDVTERYQTEKALQISNDKFEKAFNHTPNVILISHLGTGKIYEVNQTFEKLLGYTREEVLGKTTQDIDLWHDLADRAAYIAALKEKGAVDGTVYSFNTKEGRVLVAQVHASLVTIDNEEYTLAVSEDITEKQNNLKELERKSKELETIIQEAPNPIMLYDEEGKVLLVNGVWENLTGYRYEEIDTIEKWTQRAYGKKGPIVKEHIDRLGLDEAKHSGMEFAVTTKNGETIIWQFSSAPLGIIDGKRTIITTAMDITELKQKDQLMMVQSRHAAMGEMIGMIAHQWRQPVSGIAMDANNMLLDIALGDFSAETVEAYAKEILEQTEHLSKTIDDFRNFFKPDKAASKVKIKELMEESYSIVKESLAHNAITFRSTYTSESKVDAYPRELMQVFVNIIHNAKDALVSGHVAEALIEVRVYDDESYVNTEICDNGRGIEAVHLSKIFDPYFTTKDEKTGSGLGLYMSKMIVEEHLHGILEGTNRGQGACFRVRLPKSRKKPDQTVI